MTQVPDLNANASKMRALTEEGIDFEVDVRFLDMLISRSATVLDVGCGIGNAVNGLRTRGHQAFGIDPTVAVLRTAHELYEPSWFRRLGASEITFGHLAGLGLPTTYDAILLAGNVPAFLSETDFAASMAQFENHLSDNGVLIIGTTTAMRGGPTDQDLAVHGTGLILTHRYSDWHLGSFDEESPWSVSIFGRSCKRQFSESPDGNFILRG